MTSCQGRGLFRGCPGCFGAASAVAIVAANRSKIIVRSSDLIWEWGSEVEGTGCEEVTVDC
jgi:hypothetical protein